MKRNLSYVKSNHFYGRKGTGNDTKENEIVVSHTVMSLSLPLSLTYRGFNLKNFFLSQQSPSKCLI